MTDDRPGPFPSARAALGWYWRTRDSRAAPRAIDPSRQCISGSTDGAVKLYGQWVDAEGTYALCALCLKEFTREEERVLRLGWFGAVDSQTVAHHVREWAIEAGARPDMRIALCGYDGEHVMPASWAVFAHKTQGGYGNQAADGENANRYRERIWFSPACLAASQPNLFGAR